MEDAWLRQDLPDRLLGARDGFSACSGHSIRAMVSAGLRVSVYVCAYVCVRLCVCVWGGDA